MEENISKEKIIQHSFYTLKEEIFNAISHGLGVMLSIAGCTVALFAAFSKGDALSLLSSAIYGATLIIMYTMSTLYHSFTNRTAKKVFRIFDHCSIYLLIAGTYTPFTLISLKGVFGYTIFGIVWAVGILGIVLSSVNMEKFKRLLMICYLATGWLIIIATKPLLQSLESGGITLLLIGGLMYTGGVLFYRMKKIRYMHAIWHLFVLAGSVLHYFSILFYVI